MAQFSLLTFNCFGVPAPMTRHRLLALAAELNRRPYSVVCLQEVQATIYRNLLLASCTDYPVRSYEPFVYAPKGGLLTLARLAVDQQAFALYRAREIVSPLAMMDIVLHKGVLITRTNVNGVPIVVLNTHLSANYNVDWNPNNRYARVEHNQLRQLAEIVQTQAADALVIAAGDFNIPRGSWLYDDFLAHSGMIDPLAGDLRPTYRMPRGMPATKARPIDFTFLRLPSLPGVTVHSDRCFDQQVPLTPKRQGYLSDHYGIEVHIHWEG